MRIAGSRHAAVSGREFMRGPSGNRVRQPRRPNTASSRPVAPTLRQCCLGAHGRPLRRRSKAWIVAGCGIAVGADPQGSEPRWTVGPAPAGTAGRALSGLELPRHRMRRRAGRRLRPIAGGLDPRDPPAESPAPGRREPRRGRLRDSRRHGRVTQWPRAPRGRARVPPRCGAGAGIRPARPAARVGGLYRNGGSSKERSLRECRPERCSRRMSRVASPIMRCSPMARS